jgi:hypothetical protein
MDHGNFNGGDVDCNKNDSSSCLSDEEFLKKAIYPEPYIWIIVIIFNCFVFFFGLVGNGMVAWNLFRNRDMRTVTNMLLGNLAVSDFLVILFCLPSTLVWDLTESWFLGTTFCKMLPFIQVSSNFW